VSATWTCICGKTFNVFEWRQSQMVTCPSCGFELGEAVPETFESPRAIQAEESVPRTMLASPEVAVQAEEPMPRRVLAEHGRAKDIDIRKRPMWRSIVLALILVLGIIVLGFGALFAFTPFGMVGGGTSLIDVGSMQTKVLTNACENYRLKHQKYPESLEVLLRKDEFNTIYVDDPDALNDPWGRPYQYDPKGPKNTGKRPDIWFETPDDGRVIGNWPKNAPPN